MVRLPLKTITILVCAALAAIFCYQVYWLYSLYDLRKQEMVSDIKEALRICDYNEMVLRLAVMAANEQRHGEVAFRSEYTMDKKRRLMNTGTQTTVSMQGGDNVVIQRDDWRDSLTIRRSQSGKGKRYVNVDIKSRKVDQNPKSAIVADKGNMFVALVDNKNSMEDLTKMMQQGIHEGIDLIKAPDVGIFDSLLTKRLEARHIDSRHRLEVLQKVRGNSGKMLMDTILVISTTGYKPSAEAMVVDYQYGMSSKRFYRLYIDPVGRSVIVQMRGILLSSVATLLVLVFVFWYLIHTLLRQRSIGEMKDDFTHNITHELKTPIAVAYAANDAMLHFGQGRDASMREKYLKITQEQLRKLGGMVEQILSTSMERRKTFRLSKEELHLAETLGPIIEMQRLKASKPVDISLCIEPEDLCVMADRQHFCQMVNNIIDNAIKYSPGEAVVTIRCRKCGGGEVVVEVNDCGVGIPRRHLAHVFEKFYRVPNGNLHDVKGYGLGLYYVSMMMDLHGGKVEVESEEGRGSTFKMLFR